MFPSFLNLIHSGSGLLFPPTEIKMSKLTSSLFGEDYTGVTGNDVTALFKHPGS
jgi:hypothetical protein